MGGGGGDSSSSSTSTSTTTTTSTSIGEIGLIGTDIVDLAAVLTAGQVAIGRDNNKNLIKLTDFGRDLAAQNARNALDIATIAERAGSDEPSDLVKLAPFIAAAAIAMVPLLARR